MRATHQFFRGVHLKVLFSNNPDLKNEKPENTFVNTGKDYGDRNAFTKALSNQESNLKLANNFVVMWTPLCLSDDNLKSQVQKWNGKIYPIDCGITHPLAAKI